MTVVIFNDKILEENIPKACSDKRCPLYGIPMSEYLGKGFCEECKYHSARIKAFDDWKASKRVLNIPYKKYKELKDKGFEFQF